MREINECARTGVIPACDLFDFDDVCAEVGEQHGRCWASQDAGEVHDFYALQGRWDAFCSNTIG